MGLKYGSFKIIINPVGPMLRPFGQQFFQWGFRFLGHDAAVGQGRWHVDARNDQLQMPAGQIKVEWLKFVAYAPGQYRTIGYKNGAICAQSDRHALELGATQLKAKLSVDGLEHKSRVGRTSSQSRTKRNLFVQMNVQRRQGSMRTQDLNGLAHQIV